MPTLCQVLSSTFPSLREAGGIQREDLGCGHQAYEFQGRRRKGPGAQFCGGTAVSWFVRGVWEEGRGTRVLSVLTFPSLLTGLLNITFLLMGCAHDHYRMLAHVHHIGNIRVTEVLNVLEKAQVAGAGPSSWGLAWGILSGLLLAFRA